MMNLLIVLVAICTAPVVSANSSVFIRGEGSTFPSAVLALQISHFLATSPYNKTYENATFVYDDEHGDDFSGAIPELANTTTHFIGTDIGLSKPQRASILATTTTPGLVTSDADILTFPHILTGTAIIYNIPGLNSTLNITADIIASIYAGQISQWNDTAILAINPDLKSVSLANSTIIVTAREDPTGTTYEITEYIVQFRQNSSIWSVLSAPRLTLPNLPAGTKLQPDGGPAATFVHNTPYSFGYAKKKTAQARAASMAALLNAKGNFVAPSTESITATVQSVIVPAVTSAEWDLFNIGKNSTFANAYPATYISFIIVPAYGKILPLPSSADKLENTSMSRSNLTALIDWLKFINTVEIPLPTGFIPLNPELKTRNLVDIQTYLTAKAATTPQPPKSSSAVATNVNMMIVAVSFAVGLFMTT